MAEEVREPYERGLGVLLGDAEREDFPERHGDPAWIVIRDGHDGMDLRADPVPLDRYPVKPHRYYMDNFAFPKTSAI